MSTVATKAPEASDDELVRQMTPREFIRLWRENVRLLEANLSLDEETQRLRERISELEDLQGQIPARKVRTR